MKFYQLIQLSSSWDNNSGMLSQHVDHIGLFNTRKDVLEETVRQIQSFKHFVKDRFIPFPHDSEACCDPYLNQCEKMDQKIDLITEIDEDFAEETEYFETVATSGYNFMEDEDVDDQSCRLVEWKVMVMDI